MPTLSMLLGTPLFRGIVKLWMLQKLPMAFDPHRHKNLIFKPMDACMLEWNIHSNKQSVVVEHLLEVKESKAKNK